MFKKIYFGSSLLLFVVVMYIAFNSFKPIRNVKSSDVSPVKGIVIGVYPTHTGDINIQIKDDPHTYYINNAKNEGFNPIDLKDSILNKEVTLYHIKRWTPFTTDGVHPHISRLSIQNIDLFNEIVDE